MTWVAQNGSRNHQGVYHTNKSCTYLNKANGIKEIDTDIIEFHNLRECKYCVGDVELGKSGSRKYQELAKEMANNE